MFPLISLPGPLLAGVAAAGMAQALWGLHAVRRFASKPAVAPASRPPITVLKPLHGDEPMLEAALESLFTQDYPQFQIVFGVHSPADPAIAVVRALRDRYPGRDVAMVIDGARHGVNHKISNLINMLDAARHDVLVIADSDVHTAPHTLERIAAALEVPGTGAVTTLYAGKAAHDGPVGALGASYISHVFLPGALLARMLGRQDCLGATMALRRSTLAAAGGLLALVDHLADDAVLGQLVRQQGLAVRLANTVPTTTVPETSLRDLFEHELRWARTIRSLVPVGHALSLVQFPIAWALLAALATGGAAWAVALVAAAWLVRASVAFQVDRLLGLPHDGAVWWMPVRDIMCVAVIAASYRGRSVQWRGQVVPVGQPLYALRDDLPVRPRVTEPAT
jgi:ceramide glucosyltransferase